MQDTIYAWIIYGGNDHRLMTTYQIVWKDMHIEIQVPYDLFFSTI